MNRLKLLAGVVLVLLLALWSGFYGRFQFVAIILLPVSLYFILWRKDYKQWKAKNSISLVMTSVACILILAGYYFPIAGKTVAWSVGLILLICGILMLSFKEDKKLAFVRLPVYCAGFLLLTVLISGFNPFVGMKYSGNRQYRDYAYSKRGVYLIEEESLIGLRDRYSIIETPKFKSLDIMYVNQPFVAVSLSEGLGIYNLETHEYDVKPSPRCRELLQVKDTIWNMLNKDGVAYRQIILPKYWYKDYKKYQIKTRAIEDNEGNVSKDYLLDIAEEYEANINSEDLGLKSMYEDYKDSYAILGKMVRSSGCENTPMNNLAWHNAVKEMISESGLHQDTVFSHIKDIIEWGYGGTQATMNNAAYMDQVVAQFKQLEVIASHLRDFPDHLGEYEAFSRLQTAFLYKWIDEMYEEHHYSSLPMDVSSGVINCLEKVTQLLSEQYYLVGDSRIHLDPNEKNKQTSLKVHIDKNTDVEPLIGEWIAIRKEISQQLSNRGHIRYNDITAEILKSFNSLSSNFREI